MHSQVPRTADFLVEKQASAAVKALEASARLNVPIRQRAEGSHTCREVSSVTIRIAAAISSRVLATPQELKKKGKAPLCSEGQN